MCKHIRACDDSSIVFISDVLFLQVCGHNFESGELGPGTIVGSAAFNMFVIIGICVWTIPNGESRKIKHLRVFFITAFWSIFAYIWLFLILSVITPGVVEVRQIQLRLPFKLPLAGFKETSLAHSRSSHPDGLVPGVGGPGDLALLPCLRHLGLDR